MKKNTVKWLRPLVTDPAVRRRGEIRAFKALWLKEWRLWVYRPLTYVSLGFYTVIYFALVFSNSFLTGQFILLNVSEGYVIFVFFFNILIATPALAREERSGTLEWMLAAPMTEDVIISAKYSVLWLSYLLGLVLTMPVYIYLQLWVPVVFAELVMHYLMLVLLGGASLSLGMFFSTYSQRETTASLLGLGIALVMIFLNASLTFLPAGVGSVLRYVILLPLTKSFTAGVFDLAACLYYVVYTLSLLTASVYLLKRRRWTV